MTQSNLSPSSSKSPPLAGRGVPVELTSLTKRYGSFTAVDEVSLSIESGEFLTLLGASGSGKTTTLSMVAGFTNPTSGGIRIDGSDITRVPPHRRGLGMVFQQYSLFPHMSVVANVAFPLKQRGIGSAERLRRAREALEVVELAEKANSNPKELSGGQQQRVAIARALVFSPGVLLMDEPFGALDRALREKMQIEVRRIHQEFGTTIIFVTHDQQEALTLSDRVAVFDTGRIIQVGTPEDLYRRPETLSVGTFLGESNLFKGEWREGALYTSSGARLAGAPRSVPVSPAQLFVRPENIRIEPLDAASMDPAGGLLGTVSDLAFLGSDRRVEVETPEGTVVSRIPVSDSTLRPGSDVRVSWDAADALVF